MSIGRRIKIVVFVAFVPAFVAAFLTSNRTMKTVFAFAEGPLPGHTGVTGVPGPEPTCDVSGCHTSFALNSGSGQFTITGPASYMPGQTYQIMVQHSTSDMTRKRWGFELTSLDGSGNKAGTLQSSSSATQVLSDNGSGFERQYMEHTTDGTFQGQMGGASWTFNWVAPSTDVGPVTFFAAGNQANGDGLPGGDFIYTTTKTISAAQQITGPPTIASVQAAGKNLEVTGMNFGSNAVIFVNSNRQKTLHSGTDPSTVIFGKKTIKFLARGQTVMVTVKAGSMTSNAVPFTR